MKHRFPNLFYILAFALVVPAGVLTCNAADGAEKKDPSAIVNDRLDRVLADLKFDAAGLADVINFVSDATEVDLFVDWRRLEGIKVQPTTPVTCNLQGRKFSTALQEILDAAAKDKLVFQVAGSVVVISTKEGAGVIADAMKILEVRKLDAATREKLDKPIPEFMFDAISLGDAVDFFEKSASEKLLIDWAAFKKVGVDRTIPVTMKLRHSSLGDAVQLLFFSVLEKPVNVSLEKEGVRIAPAKQK